MFEMSKTLIVVYKDEMLMNQLKKLVETNDDVSETETVGTKDGSINLVSWTEKVWLENKRAGVIKDKVLFLGDIKGTEKLIPVVDIKFDDCGAKFGWAGRQAVLFADLKAVSTADSYREFLKKLSELPVPDVIKKPQNLDIIRSKMAAIEKPEILSKGKQKNRPIFLKKAQEVFESGAEVMGRTGSAIADRTSDLFRDRNAVKRQRLFYGVVNLYKNELKEFMEQ